MNILRVAQKTYPDVTGGMPYHVHSLSRDQAAAGHDVTVATVRHDRSLPAIEAREDYTIRRFDPIASPLGNDVSFGLGRFLRNSRDFDVVHAHSHLYFSTNLAAVVRRFNSVPLAITNHGLFSQTAPETVFRWYLRTLGKWTFNRADLVFCYTDRDVERLQSLGVTTQTAVIPNGVEFERFRESDSTFPVDTSGPVVLFVGRLVEGKRPRIALEAFRHLVGPFPEARLLVCGDGPLRTDLETTADEWGLRESINFLGTVEYDDMPAIYRAGDVLLLPSRAEGVPRTVMEALAAGTPVVSSDLPQVRDAFGDAISYAPIDDAETFASQAIESLDGSGSSTLDEQYRWDRTVEQTTKVLESLVDESNSMPAGQ